MPTKKTQEPITKCTRPKDTPHRSWPDCDRCWVANCGYSRLKKANPHWRTQKHAICRYEHCIENMPLGPDRTAKSCPIFGHNCPGGARSAEACRRQVERERKSKAPKGKNRKANEAIH